MWWRSTRLAGMIKTEKSDCQNTILRKHKVRLQVQRASVSEAVHFGLRRETFKWNYFLHISNDSTQYRDITHGINMGHHSLGTPPYKTRSDLQVRCLETDIYILFVTASGLIPGGSGTTTHITQNNISFKQGWRFHTEQSLAARYTSDKDLAARRGSTIVNSPPTNLTMWALQTGLILPAAPGRKTRDRRVVS
jgi:hypothetical protein